MKPWIILIVLAVTITAASTVAVSFLSVEPSGKDFAYPAPPKPDAPPPALVIDEDLTYNYGVMAQQTQGKHAWPFKNTGPGPLELRGTATSCSCTSADLFEEKDGKTGKTITLQPGESRPIQVTWNTKLNDGKWGQTVTIGTNDPMRPQVVLGFMGTVRPAITTVPGDPSLSLGAVSNEESTRRRIALFSADRPDLKILRVASSNPDLVVAEARPMTPEEAKGMKAEKGYAIEVTVKPSPNLGEFAEEILVETDHPQKSELRFKVKGKVTGPISVTPEKATVRGATSGDGGSEALTIWARGRPEVSFAVEKKPPGMDVTVEPIPAPNASAKGSKYRMTVKVVPGIESGRIVDEIVLKTDDPKVKELRVPVDVLVQGAR
jgi:hypothetical protein